jgi:hypothetical protein
VASCAVAVAQDKTEPDWTTASAVHDRASLQKIERVTLFITGDAAAEAQIIQQSLAIALGEMGWRVASALDIDAATATDFQSFWAKVPADVRADPDALEKYLARNWAQDAPVTINDAVEVTRLVGADAYVAGTVAFGMHRYQGKLDRTNVTAEAQQPIATSVALQVIAVPAGLPPRTILETVLVFRYGGKDFINAAAAIRSVIETERRRQR